MDWSYLGEAFSFSKPEILQLIDVINKTRWETGRGENCNWRGKRLNSVVQQFKISRKNSQKPRSIIEREKFVRLIRGHALF